MTQHQVLGYLSGLVWTIQNLADLAHDQGHLEESARLHHESLRRCAEGGITWGAFEDLIGIARLARDSGRTDDAAVLLAAADRVREFFGVLPRVGREIAVTEWEALRQQLGDRRYQEAMEEGCALPIEIAIARALALASSIEGDASWPPGQLPIGQPTAFRSPPGTMDLPPAIGERLDRLLVQLRLGLTTREVEVLDLVATGQADKEIAAALGNSRHTASKHVAALRAKLATPGRTGAVAAARQAGLL